MKFLISWILVFLWCGVLLGQDGHFSQFFNAQNFLNPGEVAMESHTLGVNFNHRRQWSKIVNPYTTNFIGVVKSFETVGLGLQWSGNQAGPASINARRLMLSFAYKLKISKTQNLSFGYRGGLLMLQLDPSQWQTDEQYSQDGGYNSNLDNGEKLSVFSKVLPDADAGLSWAWQGRKMMAKAGLTVSHLLEPDQSFIELQSEPLKRKLSIDGQLKIPIPNTDFSLVPAVLFSSQGHAQEITYGGYSDFGGKGSNHIELGLFHRAQDAVIVYVGMVSNAWKVGLSYDSNHSSLRNSSKGQGGLEISFAVKIRSKKVLEDPEPEAVKLVVLNADRDKDGILDAVDKCPDVFGWKQWKGCPDSDKDEVPDYMDACPSQPGLMVFNGCPDYDLDGLPDSQDACPSLKGPIELNGCPKEELEQRGTPENFELLKVMVHFEVDKAVLTYTYKRKLREQVIYLNNYPNARLLISGHTDATGDNRYNIALSRQRVVAVKKYLLELGVAHNRIITTHFGEGAPIASNTTEEGKAMNRRVEVDIMNLQKAMNVKP